jgi:chromosome segregation ATPase
VGSEPVDKLSEVLTNLQDMQDENESHSGSRPILAAQLNLLREVQEQMQAQLKLHDAQIAQLREVIAILSSP